MLRLRRNLQPRVSNHLAALSAVLLLVSSLVEMSDSMSEPDPASNQLTSNQENSMEPEQDALPALQTTMRKGIKISLMIFN